jgi:uncharacterized membrane protein YphA (DoxX/SURF4 family)
MKMIFLQVVIPNPQQFFTWGSFTTLAGATGIVYIICGVIQSVFDFSPKWFALVISILVSLAGIHVNYPTAFDNADTTVGLKYVIALLNGFLIFATATGSNQLIAGKPSVPDRPPYPRPLSFQNQPRTFNSNWWHH